MRHVKLRPDAEVDAVALRQIIDTAYTDMRTCLAVDPVRLVLPSSPSSGRSRF